MKRADVTVLLQFNPWGPERSSQGVMDEIALALSPYPNETIYSNRAGRGGFLLGIAHPRLRPVRISSESKREGGDVIVHGRLGGLIFGFEVDPNGTEGLLCEAVLNA